MADTLHTHPHTDTANLPIITDTHSHPTVTTAIHTDMATLMDMDQTTGHTDVDIPARRSSPLADVHRHIHHMITDTDQTMDIATTMIIIAGTMPDTVDIRRRTPTTDLELLWEAIFSLVDSDYNHHIGSSNMSKRHPSGDNYFVALFGNTFSHCYFLYDRKKLFDLFKSAYFDRITPKRK